MAYREVRMMDIDQVMRRWLAGERIRAVARSTGLDRNTVRRLIRLGQQVGLKPGASASRQGFIHPSAKDDSPLRLWTEIGGSRDRLPVELRIVSANRVL